MGRRIRSKGTFGQVLRARLAAGHAALFLMAFAATANASELDVPLRVAVRTGYAVPAGEVFEGSGSLSDTVAGQIPLRVDLGVRLFGRLYAGGFAHYGVLLPKACPGEMQCSGSNMRFGVTVAVRLFPSGAIDPWIGAGFGYELLTARRALSSTRLDLTARGLELLSVDLGVDVRVSAHIRVGPVVSLAMGRFASVALNGTATRDFGAVLHGWGMMGLRVAYDF